MDIQELYDKVSHGATFYVNFKERTIRVNKKLYHPDDIEDFNDFGAFSDMSEEDFMDVLTSAYLSYKFSVPSERSDSHHKSYFKALPYEELTDDCILYHADREFARFILEVTFLRGVCSGKLKWHDEWGSWFYQSPKDKDFVILKEWIEPKKN